MVNKRSKRLGVHIALAVSAVAFLAPFLWMVSTSLKTETSIFPKPGESAQWIPRTDVLDAQGRRVGVYEGKTVTLTGESERGLYLLEHRDGSMVEVFPEEFEPQQQIGFHWVNYVIAFQKIRFIQDLKNTLFICFSTVIGTVISCSLVAYSFARIPWRGRNQVFILVLATMMLPYQVTLIPLFVMFRTFGWTGSFKPLIIPAFFAVPFYVFLLRQFFMTIPQDLSAAARIDGCSEFGIYARIVMPLAKPALATCALFMFIYQWGDFLNPLIYLQDDRQFTLAIALQQFQNQHENLWGPLMAMSTVITIPVIVLFFLTQKTFIQGITMSGLKG